MSLNWDMRNVKPSEHVSESTMSALTESIIFYCMFIGMSEITEKNALEFYKRVRLHEKLFGTSLIDLSEEKKETTCSNLHCRDRFITFEEIKAHIGLRTNAENFTDAKFRSKVFARHSREVEEHCARVS